MQSRERKAHFEVETTGVSFSWRKPYLRCFTDANGPVMCDFTKSVTDHLYSLEWNENAAAAAAAHP